MPKPKTTQNKIGKVHYSVGAIIEKDNKYFTIERKKFPLGFAFIAGHIDQGETPEQALKRETNEESGQGFEVIEIQKITEELIPWNKCSKGIKQHYWYIYNVKVKGNAKLQPNEVKSFDWKSQEQLKKLSQQKKLEPVWEYWLKKLKII